MVLGLLVRVYDINVPARSIFVVVVGVHIFQIKADDFYWESC